MKLNKLLKKSIWSKLFFMNLIILIAIVLSQLIFQAMYFEKYYLGQKKQELTKYMNQFEEIINKEKNSEKIISFIKNTKEKEGIELLYKTSNFENGIFLEPYMSEKYLLIKDNRTKKEYKIALGKQFEEGKIEKDDQVKVLGIKGKYDYVFPRKVWINNKRLNSYYEVVEEPNLESSSNIKAMQVSPVKDEECIEGTVLKVVPENEKLSNTSGFLNNREMANIINSSEYSGTSKKESSEILYQSKKFSRGYIIAVAQIAQVNEVIKTMNSFYISIFLIALILVIIVSLIYSKILTRPLVEMSKIAEKISKCDFSKKYKINREDEIGELGKSLNLISENLEEALIELKDANIKLKEDMKIKENQENKRKELIANISHELKTPITIIQGSINGIKKGIYSTEMYEDILEETNRMNNLVKEMLEISKLESQNFKLNIEPFDLYYLFLKEVDKLNPMIKSKNLKIKFKEEDDDVIVLGDEKRINQVITNLLTNAIKYTRENGEIYVSLELKDNKYIFYIENFGVTLTREEMENIWDPFYRTEKSRNKKFGGTGLGLAIVKGILELHKTNYGVKSKKNSVEFYFSLPRQL